MVLLMQLIANVLALMITAKFLPGMDFSGSWLNLIWFGLIIGIFNYLLKLILNALWSNAIFVTLALFTLVVNICFLIMIALVVPGVAFAGFWTALWAILIISLTNYSVGAIMHYE